MAGNLVSDLTVRMSADASNLMSGVGSASGSMQGLLGTVGRINPAVAIFAGLSAAVIGFGAASVKAAGDFQQGITTLSTGAGEAQKNLQMVGDGILSLATSTGTSTKQLTDGMFMIESAGYHGSQGLAVLTAAARGAKVGQADLGVVSDATTTIMTDFSSKNVTASQAVNTLIATVSSGKTNMQALASSLSNIMPTASAAGISLTDTSAAMATMTGEGVPAAQAATYLRQTILGLDAPSKQTTDALANIGLSSKQVSDEMKVSLPGALQLITDHLKKKFPEGSSAYVNALKDISGGSKNMQGMLDLTGSHLATFKGNVENIASSVKKGGDSINGWSQVQQNFNFKVDQAKEALETLGIKIGTALLPVMGNLMGFVTPLITNFSNLTSATSPLAPIFANIGGMVRSMGTNWQQASGSFAPFLTALHNLGNILGSNMPGFMSLFMQMLNNAHSIIISVSQALSSVGVPAMKIFGQAIQGAQQFLGPVVNAIGGSLVPAIQHLVGAIAPVVTGFLSWIANSGMIVPIMSVLGQVVGVVVNILSGLINVITTVIVFFTQTELGGDILKATLIALGIVIGIIAAVVLPGLIAGFVATAASAIATGISIALAFLPITLIVLGVIAVITLVILVITHWGDIAHWLQGVWAAIAAFFVQVWSGIASFFSGLWNGIVNGVKGIWAGFSAWFNAAVSAVIAFFQNIWNGITGFISAVWNGIIAIIVGAFNTIVGWFQWLYAHNTYFQLLCDFIRNVISNVINWLTGIWNNIVNWISQKWAYLSAYANAYWMMIQVTIQSKIQQVVSWLQGIWNHIVGWISGQWARLQAYANMYWAMIQVEIQNVVNRVLDFLQSKWSTLSHLAQNAWNAVVGVFRNAWNGISGALSGIWNNISNWFSNLAGQAITWGKNIIQGFIDGINNMIGSVGNAASGIVDKVKNILGFHSPAKEGPGSDADTWSPNLMKMYAAGITGGTTSVRTAALSVVHELGVLNGSSSYQYTGRSNALGMIAAAQASGGEQHIHVHVGNEEIAHYVTDQQMKMVRLGGYRR